MRFYQARVFYLFASILVIFSIAGLIHSCSANNGKSSAANQPNQQSPDKEQDEDGDKNSNHHPKYSIGGTISGLRNGQTVTLKNHSRDHLDITGTGSDIFFKFSKKIAINHTYNIAISTQPATQTCVVTNGGTGKISKSNPSNVTNVIISCQNNPKRIFLSNVSSGVVPNFGGPSGADTICQNSLNKPTGITVKAMIVAGSTRQAAPTLIDWVLAPNQQYNRIDGTVIGTTNSSSLFIFPLENSFDNLGYNFWTGMNSDWTTNSFNCSEWTTNDSGSGAMIGTDNVTDSSSIGGGVSSCGLTAVGAQLLCVEQ